MFPWTSGCLKPIEYDVLHLPKNKDGDKELSQCRVSVLWTEVILFCFSAETNLLLLKGKPWVGGEDDWSRNNSGEELLFFQTARSEYVVQRAQK